MVTFTTLSSTTTTYNKQKPAEKRERHFSFSMKEESSVNFSLQHYAFVANASRRSLTSNLRQLQTRSRKRRRRNLELSYAVLLPPSFTTFPHSRAVNTQTHVCCARSSALWQPNFCANTKGDAAALCLFVHGATDCEEAD